MLDRRDPLAEVIARAPDGERLADALSGPFRRAIRVHPRRGTPSGWTGLAAMPWAPGCFIHDPDIDPGTRLDYHTGCAYPQDAASQLPVTMLAPRPGETIVDTCAAPGSKSTQIGLALGDHGVVVCCDSSPQRRRILAENLARQGVACAVVTPMPLDRLAEHAAGCADGVLVDAPCSGHEQRSAKQVERMAQRQLNLLRLAARLVRPGGRIVYSTCTLYHDEDEGVVESFIAEHEGWSVDALVLDGCDGDLDALGGLRLWPHRQGTEPFFACRLRAPGDGLADRALLGRLDADDGFARAWIGQTPLVGWRRGDLRFVATAEAAACALPSEARGLIIGHDERLDPWGAQALIERGAGALTIGHEQACALWAGDGEPIVADDGTLARTAQGAPLGVIRGGRLDLPSRLRRTKLH